MENEYAEFLTIAEVFNMPEDERREVIENYFLQRRANQILRSIKCGRFNLNLLSNDDCICLFRFAKNDLERLRLALGIPDILNTEQRYIVTGQEGLCILLRRLSYPNRLADLEWLFGLSAPYLSVIANTVMKIIRDNKRHLLENLDNLHWLDAERLYYYSNAVTARGAPLNNCWGFIDGTARPICRPTIDQEEYFSGHKRHHCVKYQSVSCPDGIIVSLHGAYSGRRHDAGIIFNKCWHTNNFKHIFVGIYRESNLYEQLVRKCSNINNKNYVLYGDPAYPISDLLLCPFPTARINEEQNLFNMRMSTVRQAVEWGFGQVIQQFSFLDFKKNQKLLLQEISCMYSVGVILSNCHTCLYGSQTSSFFSIVPPELEMYLG